MLEITEMMVPTMMDTITTRFRRVFSRPSLVSGTFRPHFGHVGKSR